jgi:hypothetical protein
LSVNGRMSTLNERILNISKGANKPMSCSCGSTHFYKVHTEEYADNGYSSVQVRSLSTNTETAYICLCGKAVQMKDTAVIGTGEGSRARFMKSLVAAGEFNSKNTPIGIAAGMVSLAEQAEDRAVIASLQEQVAWLTATMELLVGAAEDVEVTEEGTSESTTGIVQASVGLAPVTTPSVVLPAVPTAAKKSAAAEKRTGRRA